MSHMLPILLNKGVCSCSEVVLCPLGLSWKVFIKGRTPFSRSRRLPGQGFQYSWTPQPLPVYTKLDEKHSPIHQYQASQISSSTNIQRPRYPDSNKVIKIEFHSIDILMCRFFNSALRSNFQRRVSGRFCQGRKLLSTKIIIKLFTRIHFAYKKKEIVIGVTPYL